MTISTKGSNLTPDREALFHQIGLFSGLSDRELNSLEKGKEEWYEKGDKIISEGENDAFYVGTKRKGADHIKGWAKRSAPFYI